VKEREGPLLCYHVHHMYTYTYIMICIYVDIYICVDICDNTKVGPPSLDMYTYGVHEKMHFLIIIYIYPHIYI